MRPFPIVSRIDIQNKNRLIGGYMKILKRKMIVDKTGSALIFLLGGMFIKIGRAHV